jgi:YaiO family outer membrane protein
MKNRLLLFLLSLISTVALAQNGPSSDDLFQQARKLAFDNKNYPGAIVLAKHALAQSPDYTDIRIFLGRLYTWYDKPDSARIQFVEVLTKHPESEDGALAYGSLEFWEDNTEKALQIVNQALKFNPGSADLLLLRAKILNGLKQFREANLAVDSVLLKNPKNTEARALSSRIRDNSSKNKIGVNYDYVYFDKQFNAPWHLASFDYSRQTPIGSIAARVNYANRFNTNGTQFEIDAYPRISNLFYAYAGGGYSNNVGVFPKYKAGFSLYANLPASFEAEAGFRYISFSGPTWIYTAAVGKYYKNYWFNFRTYLTPSNNSIAQSFGLNVRYYYAGADDYFSLGIGTGISPDDPRNNVLLNNGNPYKLRSNNISAGYKHAFKTLNVLFINFSLVNQEYQLNTRGNQFNAGVGYIRRF